MSRTPILCEHGILGKSKCGQCKKAVKQKTYKKLRAKLTDDKRRAKLAQEKEWRARNPLTEEKKKKASEYGKQWRKAHPDYYRKYNKL